MQKNTRDLTYLCIESVDMVSLVMPAVAHAPTCVKQGRREALCR